MAVKSMDDIAKMLKQVRFHKKMLFGVDEADVWRKLEQLQTAYRAAFDAQGQRYEALLAERDQALSALYRAGDTNG